MTFNGGGASHLIIQVLIEKQAASLQNAGALFQR
jgi:hypothetical protein